MKPELSKKNPYWISKHRYLQLVHYCLQYNEWKDLYNTYTGVSAANLSGMPKSSGNGRTLENTAIKMAALSAKIELIENAAKETDPFFAPYIIKAVTNDGIGYDYLRTMMRIPCGRRQFYNLRRKFFWILNEMV